jgi:hypothetical protein
MTVSLVAVLAGCSVAAGPGVTGARSLSAVPSGAVGVPVVLRFADRTVEATLTDTPASRQLAAMLPLTVQLKDVWGQAKSGRLPRPLAVEGATPVHDPTPGGIYTWPLTEVVAVYYDDLGLAVPAPGLVRIGDVDTGLDGLACAGDEVAVRIDLASGTTF